MTSETTHIDYAYCGSTNFIPSKKIIRIAEMTEQVKKGSRDPVVRKKAFELAKDICSTPLNIKGMKDDNLLGIADKIFMWVRDHIAYINDPSGEYFQPSVKTLEVGAGDCDDQAILLASMLGSIGFEPVLVILPEHIYVELQINGKQLPIDPIAPNATFGTLSTNMVEHFKEKYGLDVEDYLRIPISDHLIVTASKQVVKTKTPLAMAMYLEKKAAESFDEEDYQASEPLFVKAAKMYHDAGLHADSDDSGDGLFASSNFCMGWAHLTQVIYLILNQKDANLHLLQSEIYQTISCFKVCKPYFEKHGVFDIAKDVDALESILSGHQEILLADLLMHNEDCDASLRHYEKAGEMYREAMAKTKCSGLICHAEQSLESLSHYEGISQTSEMKVERAVRPVKIHEEDDFSEKFDISQEDLGKIQERLADVTGEQLRKEFLTISIETGIPVSMLEVIHGRAVEILLKADHPHPKDRYSNVVRVHSEVMERLGLRGIDRVRVIFGGKGHVVTVRPMDDGSDLPDVIRVNKMVRDMLGVEVEDIVRLERV